MTNTINTVKDAVGILTKLAAGTLVDNLQFCKSIGKADESDYDGKNGYKAGDTVYVSIPAIYTPTTSFDITSSIQDVLEQKRALTLDIVSSIGVELNSQELAYAITSGKGVGSVYDRVIKPASEATAQYVENTMLTRAVIGTTNAVGTAGSTPFDTSTMTNAGARMSEFVCPADNNRFALLSPSAQALAINARKGFPNSSEAISKQYKYGYMGDADGFHYMSNNLLPRLTRGTANPTMTVTTTSVNGATTLALTGTGTETLTAGQVISIANVNAVHPQTKADLGFNKQFTIASLATASGGAYTVTLSGDPIYLTTSQQNVTRFPTSGDEVTIGGATGGTLSTTYTENLCYHRDAFRMVSVPLMIPTAVGFGEQYTYKGITVAIVQSYEPLKRRIITRVDFLGGFCAPRGQWACRVTS